jgi:hypothetical protein
VYKIKKHFNYIPNLVFWLLFGPAMLVVFSGLYDLYTNYFNLLTKQDHMQFFLRFFFPLSIATYVTILERRNRKKLVKDLENYLGRKRSDK